MKPGEDREFSIAGSRALALLGPAEFDSGTRYLSFTGDFGFWNSLPARDRLEDQLTWDKALLARFDHRSINLEFLLPGIQGRPIDADCERVMLDYLRRGGFDLVSLANNHALEFGAAGLEHNVDRLGGAGLSLIGLRDHPARVVELAGLRVALFSATDMLDAPDPDGRVLRCEPADLAYLAEKTKSADYRIGFAHLGSRSVYPSPHELNQARRLLAMGADLLVCTGSHFIKGFVELEGRVVLFGIGNHLLTWEGGTTEDVASHCVIGIRDGKLSQIFLLPFHNAVFTGRLGQLDGMAAVHLRQAIADRSTRDPAKFFDDPRTQAGVWERLRTLRVSDLRTLRWRHFSMGFRALIARLRRG